MRKFLDHKAFLGEELTSVDPVEAFIWVLTQEGNPWPDVDFLKVQRSNLLIWDYPSKNIQVNHTCRTNFLTSMI